MKSQLGWSCLTRTAVRHLVQQLQRNIQQVSEAVDGFLTREAQPELNLMLPTVPSYHLVSVLSKSTKLLKEIVNSTYRI